MQARAVGQDGEKADTQELSMATPGRASPQPDSQVEPFRLDSDGEGDDSDLHSRPGSVGASGGGAAAAHRAVPERSDSRQGWVAAEPLADIALTEKPPPARRAADSATRTNRSLRAVTFTDDPARPHPPSPRPRGVTSLPGAAGSDDSDDSEAAGRVSVSGSLKAPDRQLEAGGEAAAAASTRAGQRRLLPPPAAPRVGDSEIAGGACKDADGAGKESAAGKDPGGGGHDGGGGGRPDHTDADPDAARYRAHVARHQADQEAQKRRHMEQAAAAAAVRRGLRLAAWVAAAAAALVVVAVGSWAGSRPPSTWCDAGFYWGPPPPDNGTAGIGGVGCWRCPALSSSPAGSRGIGGCYCIAGTYGNPAAAAGCAACSRGLWAATGANAVKAACQPVAGLWRLGAAGAECNLTCGAEGRAADEDALLLWRGQTAPADMLDILSFALAVNCSAFRASARSSGPFLCAGAACGRLQGVCFYPEPPLVPESARTTPPILRRLCACGPATSNRTTAI